MIKASIICKRLTAGRGVEAIVKVMCCGLPCIHCSLGIGTAVTVLHLGLSESPVPSDIVLPHPRN